MKIVSTLNIHIWYKTYAIKSRDQIMDSPNLGCLFNPCLHYQSKHSKQKLFTMCNKEDAKYRYRKFFLSWNNFKMCCKDHFLWSLIYGEVTMCKPWLIEEMFLILSELCLMKSLEKCMRLMQHNYKKKYLWTVEYRILCFCDEHDCFWFYNNYIC